MFCGVYVQYLWHFTNVTWMLQTKKKKSRLKRLQLYTEMWTSSSSTSASVTWLRSDRRLKNVPLGEQRWETGGLRLRGYRLPVTAAHMSWDIGHRRLMAEWLQVASVDWCSQFCSLRDVRRRAPPSEQVCVERHLNSVSCSFNQATMAGSDKQLKKKKTLFKPPRWIRAEISACLSAARKAVSCCYICDSRWG